MLKEKSCGTIVVRFENNKPLFLVLHYSAGHWDFPKGHVEKNEADKDVALRELREETSITDVEFFPGFKEKISYYYKRGNETVFKEVFFYLVKTQTKDVKISFEHKNFKWLPFEEALERVTFQNAKKILEKANDFLKQKTL